MTTDMSAKSDRRAEDAPTYRRLRQVCLATDDLKAAESAVEELLGVSDPFRDPDLEQFGLSNALYPVGGNYLEFVAPISTDAPVRRFLARGDKRGAYMVAFDCDDLPSALSRATEMGFRKIFQTSRPNGAGFQLHPHDCGGVILEIDHHRGGLNRFGPYAWACETLSNALSADGPELTGITMASLNSIELAHRWSELLEEPLELSGDSEGQINLDYGSINFTAVDKFANSGLQALLIAVDDPAEVIVRAHRLGLNLVPGGIQFCGVKIRIFKKMI